MKYTILVLFLSLNTIGFAQFFEGNLTYKIDYYLEEALVPSSFSSSFKENLYKPKYYNKMVVFSIKNTKYSRGGYKKENQKFIYPGEQTLYRFLKKSNRVELINVSNRYETAETASGSRIPPTLQKSDSTRVINGIECNLLLLDFGMYGVEEYWYNSDTLKVNPNLFKGHSFEYFDKIFEITGSFPIEMNKITDNWCKIKLTLIDVDEKELSDNLFKLPNLNPISDPDIVSFMESINRLYMER